MTKRAWLFTNHSPAQYPYSSIKPEDDIIAVDSGLELVLSLGLKARVLIGDLDSIDKNLIPEDLETISFATEKNETDTELALNWALMRGYSQIIILNDMQGRIDHALGLIQNLEYASGPDYDLRIETGRQILFMLKEQNRLIYPTGSILSLIARSPVAEFISSRGLMYPLDGLSLYPHLSRGISNQFVADEAFIHKSRGEVLAVISNFD